jgi:sugar lactone lactonase YvrE
LKQLQVSKFVMQENTVKLRSIIPDVEARKILGGFEFTEGPLWLPEGYLIFSDIPASTIYKWNPGEKEAIIFRKPSGHSNGLTIDKQSRILACEHDRRVSRTEADGTLTTLAERFNGKRLNSPNDIVVKSDGTIYFTDPPYGLINQKEEKELPFQGVFHISIHGKLKLLDDSFDRPNGLAFSPDEKTLYVDDSARKIIRAFDVKSNGTITDGRIFANLSNPEEAGVPDGMKVDVEGNVFCTGGGGVWVIDPKGRTLGIIQIPEVPSNVAWGDEDFKTLYITARTGLYSIKTTTGGVRIVHACVIE